MTRWEFMACIDGYGRAAGWKTEEAVKPMPLARRRELGLE